MIARQNAKVTLPLPKSGHLEGDGVDTDSSIEKSRENGMRW
jgi:hypothetical protein